MKIAVDASRATASGKTGVEYYSLALLREWRNLHIPDSLILFAPNDPPKELLPLPENWTWKIIPQGRLWSQWRLLKALKTVDHDVLFCPSHIIPAYYKGLAVTTIHDVGYLERPELYGTTESWYQKWANKKSIANAAGIITPSADAKKDTVKWYQVEPQAVKVIPHGYRKELFYPGPSDEVPRGVKKPYIYFVGRIEKKKNLVNVINAYKFLRSERKVDHQLILAGKDGNGANEIKAAYQALPDGIRKDVLFLGYIDDATNSQLMRNADVFIFPSWIEGFGFPILEAMASGVPVVCSNTSSLPEVAGNAAILVDPDKPFSMAAALSKVINSMKLKEFMVKTGFRQASKFTWQKSAEETLDYIKLVAARRMR